MNKALETIAREFNPMHDLDRFALPDKRMSSKERLTFAFKYSLKYILGVLKHTTRGAFVGYVTGASIGYLTGQEDPRLYASYGMAAGGITDNLQLVARGIYRDVRYSIQRYRNRKYHNPKQPNLT